MEREEMMVPLNQTFEKELRKALEATIQLRSLLAQPNDVANNDEHPQQMNNQCSSNDEKIITLAENYSDTILNSFEASIAIVKKIVQSHDMDQPSSSLIDKAKNNACSSPNKCRPRTVETPDLTPDGYTWKKYGKKSISNTKHPREYYMCAYKKDKNCEAIKHVQKISDNPIKYRINYYAQHTCQRFLNNNNNNASRNKILEANEQDCCTKNSTMSFESKTLISPYTRTPNHAALNPPSSLSTTMNDDHSVADALPSTTMIEPIPVDDHVDVVPFVYPEVMSPNYDMISSIVNTVEDYSLMMLENSLDASDELLQDFSLWD